MRNRIDGLKLEIALAIKTRRDDHAAAMLATLADTAGCTEDDLRQVATSMKGARSVLYAQIPTFAADSPELSLLARLRLTVFFGGGTDEICEQLVEIANPAADGDEADAALGLVAQHAPEAMHLYDVRLPALLRSAGLG